MRFARHTIALLLIIVTLAICPGTSLAASRGRGAVPNDTPATVYASIKSVGLFRTGDLTGPWSALTAPTAPQPDIVTLAIGDPAHWRAVYAGTTNGMYVSGDGGATWVQPIALHGRAVTSLLVPAQGPHIALAGVSRGIYLSSDDGMTWNAVASTGRITITALAQSPQNASQFYAAGGDRLLASANAGRSWSSFGLPRLSRGTAVLDLAISVDGSAIYAGTSTGLWRLTLTSRSWQQLGSGTLPRVVSGIAVDGATLIAVSSSSDRAYTSIDGGATWIGQDIAGLNADVTAFAQDPQQPGTLLVGGSNGVIIQSTDGGQTWRNNSSVVGVSNAVLALTTGHRERLPVDTVSNPGRSGTLYVSASGHTLSGPFLAYWRAHQDAAKVLGNPETEVFYDRTQGNVRAQVFDNMELVQQGNAVVPAPIGLQQRPTGSYANKYDVDPLFQAYWSQDGDLLGAPVSPLMKVTADDGSGQTYQVQYFRNARLESTANGNRVSALGRQLLQSWGWM